MPVMMAALLGGCDGRTGVRQYTASFLDLFDTVTFVTGMARSEADFRAQAQEIHDALEVYHRLFDAYTDYEGINNLKTINDHAGIAPVQVEDALIALLQDCKTACERTGGKVNAAMGGVLALWHGARSEGSTHPESARLPEEGELRQAAEHMDFDAVHIDPQRSTVYIADSRLQLDVGAMGKGWAVEQVARAAPEGLLISVGGNVRATGSRDGHGTPWVIGIQNPDGGEYLQTVCIRNQSVVTSGDYQRYYTVDGVNYAHIIDPDTLYPARLWRSVTVICADSGWADVLSTALFLLPMEEGEALLEAMDADAMWVDAEGEIFYSSDFAKWIRS